MDTVKDSAQYVVDSAKSATSGASHEANKAVAKDSDASLSTRATAAKDSVGDKVDQKSNDASAEVNKESAKH
ncbi:hypothetical protein MMC12_006665 [Toensbergia leucococca]|nr:hypothetical protein [Toensbergia leucococca]